MSYCRNSLYRKQIALTFFIISIIFVSSGCANQKEQSIENKRRSTTDSTTETTKKEVSFQEQVQKVCDSVDSKVFTDILSVDPLKDPTYEKKFQDAISSIDKLKTGFNGVTPPKPKEENWQKGIANLNDLKAQVTKVLGQYQEYVSLTEESKTNKDPIRAIQIIDRLLKLVGEYATTLQSIQARFDQMLRVGADAGISRCAAFEVK